MAITSLSIIIPAYNESSNICTTVLSIIETLSRTVSDYEIIVIDDGSDDDTAKLVGAINMQHPQVCCISHGNNRGKGGALKTGFAVASKEWTLFIDADFQVRIESLLLLSQLDIRGAVVGYRIGRRESLVRSVGSRTYRLLVKLIFGINVRDVNCPFKLMRTALLQRLNLFSNGFLIDAELLYCLKKSGTVLDEVAVTWYPRMGGASSVRWRHLAELFRELFLVLRNRNYTTSLFTMVE